jgi:hypothetical protein
VLSHTNPRSPGIEHFMNCAALGTKKLGILALTTAGELLLIYTDTFEGTLGCVDLDGVPLHRLPSISFFAA